MSVLSHGHAEGVGNSVRTEAETLFASGFALCKPACGGKNPTDTGWPSRSLKPSDFGCGDQIGIVAGPLSAPPGHSLVIVDLDSEDAVARADEFLPSTGMEDGRPGKPRSHRYFYVLNKTIPAEETSTCDSSDAALAKRGHRGPRIRHFAGIDWIGTGSQTVCPPSLHDSGSRREWTGGRRGVPAIYPFSDLFKSVQDLVVSVGGSIHRNTQPMPCVVKKSKYVGLDTTTQQQSTTHTHGIGCVFRCTPDDDDCVPWPPPNAPERVLERTLPIMRRTRNDSILYLARTLRDHLPADADEITLRRQVARWLRMAREADLVNTRDFYTTWKDFVHAWQRVHTPISESRPIKLMRDAAAKIPGNKTEKLKAMCRALADSLGGAFELSGRTAAEILDLDAVEASRKIKELVQRGWLDVVRKSPNRRHAHLYTLGRSAW